MKSQKKETAQKFIKSQKNQALLDIMILKKHMVIWKKLLIGKMLNKSAGLQNFQKKLSNRRLMKLTNKEI
jgi:hypothetical protein